MNQSFTYLFAMRSTTLALLFSSEVVNQRVWKVKLETGAMARLQPPYRHANHDRDGRTSRTVS